MVVCADIVGQVELAGKGARVHRWNQRQNRYSVRGDWALSDRFLCSYLRKQHFVFEPTLTRIEGCETAAAALPRTKGTGQRTPRKGRCIRSADDTTDRNLPMNDFHTGRAEDQQTVPSDRHRTQG